MDDDASAPPLRRAPAPVVGPGPRAHRAIATHVFMHACGVWMATDTLPAGTKDTDPHPQCKSQTRTRTRDPRRVESYARTRHPRVCPRTRREPWRSGRRTADAGRWGSGRRTPALPARLLLGRRHSLLASSRGPWGRARARAGAGWRRQLGGADAGERAGGGGLEERAGLQRRRRGSGSGRRGLCERPSGTR